MSSMPVPHTVLAQHKIIGFKHFLYLKMTEDIELVMIFSPWNFPGLILRQANNERLPGTAPHVQHNGYQK
jgi:hypothetical protein